MTLIGRIGGTPVTGETKNGNKYTQYKVATTDATPPAKEGEQPREPTTSWHTIFAYGKSAERLADLEKGSLVHVDAHFRIVNEKTESGDFTSKIYATHDRLHLIRRAKASSEDGDLEASLSSGP